MIRKNFTRILCFILALCCAVCFAGCKAKDEGQSDISATEPNADTTQQTQPDNTVSDEAPVADPEAVMGVWVAEGVNTVYVFNTDATGAAITYGSITLMPYYGVGVTAFTWECDGTHLHLDNMAADGTVTHEELEYSVENGQLVLSAAEAPLDQVTLASDDSLTGQWKAFAQEEAILVINEDGTWAFTEGNSVNEITGGTYTLVSDENASFCEAVMYAPDGDYVLRVRLLSNGLLEMQAGTSWLLEK